MAYIGEHPPPENSVGQRRLQYRIIIGMQTKPEINEINEINILSKEYFTCDFYQRILVC